MNKRDQQLLDAYERGFALQQEYLGTDKPVNRIEPLVSVRTATYQHAPFIRQCLDSILMQETDFPWEFIIGEDGSTDGTREICIEYAERHPDRIRLFLRDRKLSQYQEGDRTIRFNGKWLTRSARGKYIASCEGDDYWTDPKKLQKQVDFLESHPDCSMCFHNFLVISEHKQCVPRQNLSNEMESFYSLESLSFECLPQTATVMCRSPGIPKQRPAWQFRVFIGDWLGLLLLAQRGLLAYIPETMSVYRVHTRGIWNGLESLVQLEKKVDVLSIARTRLRLRSHTLNEEIARLRLDLAYAYDRRGQFSDAARHAQGLLVDMLLRRWKPGTRRFRWLLSVWMRSKTPSFRRIFIQLKNKVTF